MTDNCNGGLPRAKCGTAKNRKLCGSPPSMIHVVASSDLEELLQVFDSREAAVAKCLKSSSKIASGRRILFMIEGVISIL
jgi:hypothetical protein